MHRVTASLLHGKRLGLNGQWASALIWGSNKHATAMSWSNSILAESEAILDSHNTLFMRSEVVQKSAEDLVVAAPVVLRSGTVLSGFAPEQRFSVGHVQLGYVRELIHTHGATLGLGSAGTISFVPGALEPYYGSRNPAGAFIFLRLRPFHRNNSNVPMDMKGMPAPPRNE
jgi:hypothetical protein